MHPAAEREFDRQAGNGFAAFLVGFFCGLVAFALFGVVTGCLP